MRVLVVKTSSMGDLVHTLPALTDATEALGDIRLIGYVSLLLPRSPTGTHLLAMCLRFP